MSIRSAVVVNPAKVSNLRDRRQQIRAALAAAGCPEPLWLETSVQDPGSGQTRQAIEAGVDVVFVYGGDGTVMACATELAGTPVALAVLAGGTGNLLAINLDLPGDIDSSVRAAVGPGRRRIDVGLVGERCFTVMAGMGFDAAMLDGTRNATKARLGSIAYVLSGLRRLRDRPMRVRIRCDGQPVIHRRVRTVLVANVGRLQGGVPLLPEARPDDGLLDVAVVRPRTLADWLTLAWGVLRRRTAVRHMDTFRTTHVEIFSDRVQPRELDGDLIEPARQLTVDVRPAALVLCVPTSGEGSDAYSARTLSI